MPAVAAVGRTLPVLKGATGRTGEASLPRSGGCFPRVAIRRCNVAAGGGDRAAGAVAVVMPDPVGQLAVDRLVAAYRRNVEKVVSPEKIFAAARVSRIGVEDGTRRVLVEDAASGQFVDGDRAHIVIIKGFAASDFVLVERDVKIIVEVA